MNLSHVDSQGNAKMVDVSDKQPTTRSATASGSIRMCEAAFVAVEEQDVAKGDVLTVAKIAGIQAAKQTAQMIPMCHPLPLSHVDIQIVAQPEHYSYHVTATVKTTDKTGVEMEALTAVSVTLLTIYDMVKAIDKSMVLSDIRLLEKTGGKSGVYTHEG